MSRPSEIEYCVAREQWHLEMAIAAVSPVAVTKHLALARRYGDYDYPILVIADD